MIKPNEIREYRIENIESVSINECYVPIAKGKVIMSKNANNYKKRLMQEFAVIDMLTYKSKLSKYFSYQIEITYELAYKNLFVKDGKKLIKRDVDNPIKLIIDSFFSYINNDDRTVIDVISKKRLSKTDTNNIVFRISCYEKDKTVKILSD